MRLSDGVPRGCVVATEEGAGIYRRLGFTAIKRISGIFI